LFEDTAGAGWVRVERGVRHAIKPEAPELAMRLVSRVNVYARGIMPPNPRENFGVAAQTEKSDSRSMIVVVGVMRGFERQQRHS